MIVCRIRVYIMILFESFPPVSCKSPGLGHHKGGKGHGLLHRLLGEILDGFSFSKFSHEILLQRLVVFVQFNALQYLTGWLVVPGFLTKWSLGWAKKDRDFDDVDWYCLFPNSKPSNQAQIFISSTLSLGHLFSLHMFISAFKTSICHGL